MSEMEAGDTTPATTATRLLGGRLVLRQPRTGHRVGTDALLLAAAVSAEAGQRVVDAGSGVGSVGLALAVRVPGVAVHLLERNAMLAQLARDNAEPFGARVTVENADLLVTGGSATLRPADWVISNPPFQLDRDGRPSPDASKAAAYRLDGGVGHGDWLRAMLRLAGPRGAIALIHRPDALPALLSAAHGRLGGISVLPIHPREGQPAIRILFGGRLGSRAPLTLRSPLTLHGADGGFLDEAAAIQRGEAVIDLFGLKKGRP